MISSVLNENQVCLRSNSNTLDSTEWCQIEKKRDRQTKPKKWGVSEREREKERKCVWSRERKRKWMCVCVCKREGEREKVGERESVCVKEWEREGTEKKVCVWVRESEWFDTFDTIYKAGRKEGYLSLFLSIRSFYFSVLTKFPFHSNMLNLSHTHTHAHTPTHHTHALDGSQKQRSCRFGVCDVILSTFFGSPSLWPTFEGRSPDARMLTALFE